MKRNDGYFRKVLAVLCAVSMLATFSPTLAGSVSYAAEEDAAAAVEANADENSQGEPAEAESSESSEEGKESVSAEEDKGDAKAEPEKETAPVAENAKAEKQEVKKDSEKANDSTPAAEKQSAGDKKDGDKEKTVNEKVFKAEFDLTENYAHFGKINAMSTDKNGKLVLPEKPEARKDTYKGINGKEYYFTGWEYDDKEYEPGDEVILSSDAVFEAVWKQTYTITFSAKGLEADKIEPLTAVCGEPVELPDETASEDGYDFIGWTPDNGKTIYASGKSIAPKTIQSKRTNGMVRLRGVTEDTSKPEVFIQYTEKKPDVNSVTFTVTAMDKGSGIDTIEVKIPGYMDGQWFTVEDGYTGDVQDGQTLSARATDQAGNVSDEKNVTADLSKDYDATAPTITINSVDGESGQGEAAVAKPEHTINFSVR